MLEKDYGQRIGSPSHPSSNPRTFKKNVLKIPMTSSPLPSVNTLTKVCSKDSENEKSPYLNKNHTITVCTFINTTIPLFFSFSPCTAPSHQVALNDCFTALPTKMAFEHRRHQKVPAELPAGEVSQATEL